MLRDFDDNLKVQSFYLAHYDHLKAYTELSNKLQQTYIGDYVTMVRKLSELKVRLLKIYLKTSYFVSGTKAVIFFPPDFST